LERKIDDMPTQIKTYFGDITALEIDCIVNAANAQLAGGGGVDLAIHNAAGQKLFDECQEIRKTKFPNGLPEGEAVITQGYSLPAKYVIHTVGPIWYGGGNNEAKKLYNCYFNSLKLAMENEIRRIAFPAISTGVFGYSKEKAKKIADKAVADFVKQNPEAFDEITHILYKK